MTPVALPPFFPELGTFRPIVNPDPLNNYFCRQPHSLQDFDMIKPGQAMWWGPFIADLPLGDIHYRMTYSDCLGWQRDKAKEGVHLHVSKPGRFLRVYRLQQGPSKKLSDWKQMEHGRTMLINPCADFADVERAERRAKNMHYNGVGRFRCTINDDRALWVERL